jgi:hypothetical protein
VDEVPASDRREKFADAEIQRVRNLDVSIEALNFKRIAA